MKKWIELKVDEPIYILKRSRNGDVYGYIETKCEGFQDIGYAVGIFYYDDNEENHHWTWNKAEDEKVSTFAINKDDLQSYKVEKDDFIFYTDKESVLEDLNKYQIKLNKKQEELDQIFKQIEL
jgi:hypothetical protein